MIADKFFNDTISRFPVLEEGGSFYEMAVNLLNNNFKVEACLLILATWNFAYFRYVVKELDINSFRRALEAITPEFYNIQNEELRSIDFKKQGNDIEKIYNTLSSFSAIKATGASKIMHLYNRKLFIMWDRYIRGEKPKKHYQELEIYKNSYMVYKKYNTDGKGYIQFLQDMSKLFYNVTFKDNGKTFAKAIDEFNYVSITIPYQGLEKKLKKKKKK